MNSKDNRVVVAGRGPAVRFKTKSQGRITVVSKGKVTTIEINKPSEVTFSGAA